MTLGSLIRIFPCGKGWLSTPETGMVLSIRITKWDKKYYFIKMLLVDGTIKEVVFNPVVDKLEVICEAR